MILFITILFLQVDLTFKNAFSEYVSQSSLEEVHARTVRTLDSNDLLSFCRKNESIYDEECIVVVAKNGDVFWGGRSECSSVIEVVSLIEPWSIGHYPIQQKTIDFIRSEIDKMN